jgi:hypothetical protein
VRSGSPGELNRKYSYRTRSTVNQNAIALSQVGAIEQTLPSRQRSNRHRGRVTTSDVDDAPTSFMCLTAMAPKGPVIKGSKNVKFRPLRAIFRVASANSTNKRIATAGWSEKAYGLQRFTKGSWIG